MKNKNNKALKDVLVLSVLPLASLIPAWFFRLNFLTTTLLFFGLPSAFLSFRDPTKVKRAVLFAPFFSVAGIYADYMAEKDLEWAEPLSIFKFRIAGTVPIESVIWFFLMTYLIVVFYEHFFDHFRHHSVGRRMKFLYIILTFMTLLFILPLALHAQLPVISYFYLKLGILLGLLPLIAFSIKFPRFVSVFLKITPYFLGLSVLDELVGLHNRHWAYPGRQFIGWINLGTYRFPYEEVLFWMIIFSSVVIAYFEFFDDNRLKFRPQARLHRSSK